MYFQAAKEFSKLKETRSQMDSDMQQAMKEFKFKNINSKLRPNTDKIIAEYTKEREERVDRFLSYVENQRSNLFFPNYHL